MSVPVKTQQELYDLFIQTLEDLAPDLTDTNEGSTIDAEGGVFSVAATELTRLIVNLFNKTFFNLSNGPLITGGPDDLQTLAVDHFGDGFARPRASKMTDNATFSRANNSKGQVTILAGSIIKTVPDANGTVQRYATNSDLILTNNSSGSDLTGTVGITAVVAGAASNASSGKITVIETSLTDSTIVVTNTGSSNGEDALTNDEAYRALIKNLIQALAGATAAAIAAKALTVSGVATATTIEQAKNVIEYDIATGLTVGTYFRIPVPYLYIADSTGNASVALILAVQAAINQVKACGAFIQIKAATSVSINWTASFTLNPGGPNYSTFVNDPAKILASMKDYIDNLPIGTSFVRATANARILAIWGAAGTNDLTAFSTSIPSGDVALTAGQKAIAGTVAKV